MGWDPSLPKGKGGLFFSFHCELIPFKPSSKYLFLHFEMARALGIDYGGKRCGIAVTDPLRISVNPLASVLTNELDLYLKQYLEKEPVDLIVIGDPAHRDGQPTDLGPVIHSFGERLKLVYPSIRVDFVDERNSSVQAVNRLVRNGTPKNKRNKEAIDQMSAILILQKYLNHI